MIVEKRPRRYLLHRIYTEDKPEFRDRAMSALRDRGMGFTICTGVGQDGPTNPSLFPPKFPPPENSLIIDVVTEATWLQSRKIESVAEEIREKNSQYAVLVVTAPISRRLAERIQGSAEQKVRHRGRRFAFKASRRRVFLNGRIVVSAGRWKKLVDSSEGDCHQLHLPGIVFGGARGKNSGKYVRIEL
ncbi:MAG TPA: hypothetical protein VLY23_05440 [Candidatus Acidoferrum sp.]|nr:hypothetical protein [Candidatus Acidoferrum sp.]